MEAQNEILRGILKVKKENAAIKKEMLVAKQQEITKEKLVNFIFKFVELKCTFLHTNLTSI